jgi:hypothetical protein
MNVFNAQEVKLDIFIEVFILIAFPSSAVCHGIYLENKKHFWVCDLKEAETISKEKIHMNIVVNDH